MRTDSALDAGGRITVLLSISAMVSWLGELIHNAVELAGLTLLSPENSIPGLIAAFFLASYLFSPFPRGSVMLLLVWGLLNLIGGGVISVLPLRFLPFSPAQNVTHYLAHIVYSAAEIPLILVSVQLLRRRQSEDESGS